MSYNKILINLLVILITLYFGTVSYTKAVADHNFKVVVLGSGGGPVESNLSSFLLSTSDSNNYVALDAGTLLHGIKISYEKKAFDDVGIPEKSDIKPEFFLLQNNIKAYLLTHAHLDHIAGLITASPYDKSKYIYGLASTLGYISDNIFNWQVWPNFGNQGKQPVLDRYKFVILIQGKEYPIAGTSMKVRAFPLSHSNNYISTAFLISSGSKYILYIGDTGPDKLENSSNLDRLWNITAPIIDSDKLSALFIECSFTNDRADKMLYGHLTPRWVLQELENLSSKLNAEKAEQKLKGLAVVITHIKQDPRTGTYPKSIIKYQLDKGNDLVFRFIFPEQGEKIFF